MSFRFPLQKLLDLRVERERSAAADLTSAEQAVATEESVRSRLQGALSQGRAQLSSGGPRSVGDLRHRQLVLDQLGQGVERAETRVREAQQRAERRRGEFVGAVRDRRAVDLLREKRLEEWREAEVQTDLAAMNEIALARFFRAGVHSTAAVRNDSKEG